MHTLFPIEVRFKEDTHQYFNSAGEEYISVSHLLKTIAEEFDPDGKILAASAKKRGVSPEELQKEWRATAKKGTDHGSRIHNALEYYDKTGQIHSADQELEPAIKSITSYYRDYYQCHNEIMLYSHKYKIAGTTDKLNIVSSRGKWVDISDYKTNLKGITYFSKYGKTLLHPFNHLQDCSYVKYSFQLSLYAYMFEQLTNYKIRQLFIHFIDPIDHLQHRQIPALYLKPEVEYLLNEYESKKVMEKSIEKANAAGPAF